ncbi:hypothetical protein PRABACTJOHN_03692 [Parabacteroides johnsonii DSM 18315]|uniref:Uncharacterized protein n=1 Tax=Parabacteroides johnsonii DSM 18315 TaxID=537006 RepID=B7BF63_9BACT|nr:hypothetical protein PRABACTJOHN_03692 [Parabacteroides johnsonii DSM 18315]
MNGRRILWNTQIFDLRKVATKIWKPLVQAVLGYRPNVVSLHGKIRPTRIAGKSA